MGLTQIDHKVISKCFMEIEQKKKSKKSEDVLSKEALLILKETIALIKSLNAERNLIDPALLSMTSKDIANALAKKIDATQFISPPNRTDASE